jgi:hypothetical protein
MRLILALAAIWMIAPVAASAQYWQPYQQPQSPLTLETIITPTGTWNGIVDHTAPLSFGTYTDTNGRTLNCVTDQVGGFTTCN